MNLPRCWLPTGCISLILVGCNSVIEPASQAVIPVKGECGELGCEELWRSLQNTWPEIFSELEMDCPVVASYGLDTWGYQGQEIVSVTCWQPQAPTLSSINGNVFRFFPYPGTEATFFADVDCGDRLSECTDIWEVLTANYPEEIRQMRQTCAFRRGSILLWPDGDRPEIDLRCAFFAPDIQIDSDGDGIRDGESKPTAVNFSLGILPLNPTP